MGQVVKPAADWQSAIHWSENPRSVARGSLLNTFRYRRLPHLHAIGQPVFLTWRLSGSLPPGRAFPTATTHGQAFRILGLVASPEEFPWSSAWPIANRPQV